MISLDVQNVSARVLGEADGLALDALFPQRAAELADAVRALYAQKDTSGAWSRWLNLGYDETLCRAIQDYAASVRGKFDQLVVLGIGGSSLGGLAVLKALKHPYWNELTTEQRGGLPRYYFVDNVDSDQIAGLIDIVDLERTLFLVITKSGTTAETMSAFLLLKDRLESTLGAERAKDHWVAITDAKTGILRPLAEQCGVATFEVPDDVGGRFSVFSAVGLLPAALCGVDIAEMQRGIRDIDAVLQNPDLTQNPAAQNALIQISLYERGKPISVFMPYSSRLAAVADWYVQLWAESLGKRVNRDGRVVNVGPTPLRAVGATDQHSQIQLYNEGPNDKVVTFVAVEAADQPLTIPAADNPELAYLGGHRFHDLMTAEFQATRASLTQNQRPNVTFSLPKVDAYHVGQLLYLLEVQTGIAGTLLNIDPFDQPGVELAKIYTYALMGRPGFEDRKPSMPPAVPSA